MLRPPSTPGAPAALGARGIVVPCVGAVDRVDVLVVKDECEDGREDDCVVNCVDDCADVAATWTLDGSGVETDPEEPGFPDVGNTVEYGALDARPLAWVMRVVGEAGIGCEIEDMYCGAVDAAVTLEVDSGGTDDPDTVCTGGAVDADPDAGTDSEGVLGAPDDAGDNGVALEATMDRV